jgi:hypothetical protein
MDENNLSLYWLDGSTWVIEPTSVVDVLNNIITATPNHMSLWAILSEYIEDYRIYLPLVSKNY